MEKLIALFAASFLLLGGCENIGFNRNMLEYLEYYSSTATTANITSGFQPNYGMMMEQNPNDKMLYTVAIPQSLLQELDLQDNLQNRQLTLTIPAWLNSKTEKAGVNFSQVLQDALKKLLTPQETTA